MYGVLRKCRGKYIAILEGDDWWEAEDKLQYQFDFMESHPEISAVAGLSEKKGEIDRLLLSLAECVPRSRSVGCQGVA